jgi:RNA polymerase subunit RPABC4/transcription elongation factor Spt4
MEVSALQCFKCFRLVPDNLCLSAHNSTSKTVQWIIIIITTLVTILAMQYVKTRQATVVQEIVYERRKRRQELQHLGTTNPLGIYEEVGTVYPPGDVYKP